MSTFYIFHFRPLEHYPPIQNLLTFLNESEGIEQVYCFSTKGQLESFQLDQKVKVYRWGKVGGSKLSLWLTYLIYNMTSIFFLLFKRPAKVMYFESLSAFPVYVYKRFINTKAKVFIHYHEYTSPEEYQKASPVERFFHNKEIWIYPKAQWISHTNEVRLTHFLADEKLSMNKNVHQIMPNYPSRKWAQKNQAPNKKQKLKMIYVGYSLTENGSYLKELVHHLKTTEFLIELNVYCMQNSKLLKELEGIHGHLSLKLNGAVPYDQLPDILSQHHIGLILYKANTPNYVYNAPNKLFEYLSCGLDVWYPEEMEGIHAYDCDYQPKVLRLDFNKLDQYPLKDFIKDTEVKNKNTYFAEEVYKVLLNEIT